VEVTPTHNAASYRIAYPAGQPAHLVFDITRKVGGLTASDMADVAIDPAKGEITGRVRAKGYWSPALVDIWFVAQVDQPIRSWGTAIDGARADGSATAASGRDQKLAVWPRLATTLPRR
jgi:putative alpha-1,2-mannosidase